MSEIDGLIRRLDAWLQENRPEYYASLNPGATSNDLGALAQTIGTPLPIEIEKLFLWKNGEKLNESDDAGLLPFNTFLTIEQSIQTIHTQWELIEEDDWFPGFIPFLYNIGGDYLCIDTNGEFDDHKGQIVYWCHDDCNGCQSDNLSQWLRAYLIACEKFQWRSDDWFTTFYNHR